MASQWAAAALKVAGTSTGSIAFLIVVTSFLLASLTSTGLSARFRTSPVVAVFATLACEGTTVAFVGAFAGWDTSSMLQTAVGSLAAIVFLARNNSSWSLLWAAASVVMLAVDVTSGEPLQRALAAVRISDIFLAGAAVHVLVAYLFRGSQTVLAQAIVGAAVATMLTGVQDTTTFAVVACLIAVLLVATSRATPSVRGSLFTDVRIMELCLLISLCLCLMAVPWQGALAAAATMLALAAFALPAVRAKAPVFLPSASADSQGLTLQFILFAATAFRSLSVPASPSGGSTLTQALLTAALGYTGTTLIFAVQQMAMEPLQLYAAAASRASTLDYVALQALLTGSVLVLLTQSTKPAVAAAWLGKQWVHFSGPQVAAALRNHPGLAPLGIAQWSPAQFTALAAVAVYTVGLGLQAALARSTLLFAPLVGEVTARGSPRKAQVALTYSLTTLRGAQQLLDVLAAAGAHATFFLPARVGTGDDGPAFVKAALAVGHELGLQGEEGENIGSSATALGDLMLVSQSAAVSNSPSSNTASVSSTPITRMARNGVPIVDTARLMVNVEGAAMSGVGGLTWYRPPADSRDVSLVVSANAVGLSVALWSAYLDGSTPASLLDDQLSASTLDIAKTGLERAKGAVIAVCGTCADTARVTQDVLRVLAGKAVTPAAVVPLSVLCPDGGKVNEVLRVGGA